MNAVLPRASSPLSAFQRRAGSQAAQVGAVRQVEATGNGCYVRLQGGPAASNELASPDCDNVVASCESAYASDEQKGGESESSCGVCPAGGASSPPLLQRLFRVHSKNGVQALRRQCRILKAQLAEAEQNVTFLRHSWETMHQGDVSHEELARVEKQYEARLRALETSLEQTQEARQDENRSAQVLQVLLNSVDKEKHQCSSVSVQTHGGALPTMCDRHTEMADMTPSTVDDQVQTDEKEPQRRTVAIQARPVKVGKCFDNYW